MNRLAQESSPYLRQHRDNPVDWYPWGPEAFERARAENRPVLLSVGYSACHWCHVMAHECFEDDDVASVMNTLFVNVKVDREERPDVDSVYMDAIQAISGRGGWPMTVFLAPDARPFYGGTYFPKPQFLQLMAAVDDAWRNRPDELLGQATQLTEVLDRTARVEPADDLPTVEHMNNALGQLAQAFDPTWGGFGAAPKFPSTMSLELVLRAHLLTGSSDSLQVVTTSLDAMASGGMYDHLGGGFARYSVDERWLVPHFEKMLYDQALLARAYLHGWQVTGNRNWLQVLEEMIEYVLRDLGQPSGGFSSAEDADSTDDVGHSEEGWFYIWTIDEVRAVLGPEVAEAAINWYGITEHGNFEGRNILTRPERGVFERPDNIERARAALFEHRLARARPGLDDKVLTEWNGLFLDVLAEAAGATGNRRWLDAARANAEFLCREQLGVDGRWRRSWQRDGGSRHLALAADHAALVGAFISMAEATGEARWIESATSTADAMLDRFWDPQRGGLFTTADDGEELVARQKDLMDNATPSANSMAANALYRLAALTGQPRYREHADQILRLMTTVISGAPSAFSHLLAAVDVRLGGVIEVVIAGDRPDLVEAAQRVFIPRRVLAWGERYPSPLWEGRNDGFAYVCRDYTCAAPADTIAQLMAGLDAAVARSG